MVVSGLLGDDRGREIARQIRQHHPDVDFIAEATEWRAAQVDVPVARRRVYPLRPDAVSDMIGASSG